MNPAPVQSLLSRPVHTPVTLVPYEEPAEPAGPESGRRWLNEVLSCGYSSLGGADTGVLKSVLTVDLDPDMLLESPEGAAVIFPAEIYQAVFGKKIPELNENTVPGDISSRDEITLKELENASKAVKKTGQNGSALDMIMEERGEDHYREWHGYLRELQEDLLAESSKP